MRIRTQYAVALGTVALVLTGCVDSNSMPTLPPSPTATPIFASEEEALAAAEDAYVAYQAAIDVALQSLESTKLESVAVGPALEAAKQSIERLRSEGARQEGRTTVKSVQATDLAALTEAGDDSPIQIYACLDLSGVRIVAADGSVSQSQVATFPMLVTLRLEESSLLTEEETVWDADSFC